MRDGLPSSIRSEIAVVEAVREELQSPIGHNAVFEPRDRSVVPLGDLVHDAGAKFICQ